MSDIVAHSLKSLEQSEQLRGHLETLGAYANDACPPEQALEAIREVKSSVLGKAVSQFLNRTIDVPGTSWACDAAAEALLKGGLEKILCFEPLVVRAAREVSNNTREQMGLSRNDKTMPDPVDVELRQARVLGGLVNTAKERTQQQGAVAGVS